MTRKPSVPSLMDLATARRQIVAALDWVQHLEAENGYDLHDLHGYLVHALACLEVS